MTAAHSIAKLDVLADARTLVVCDAFAVAFCYGNLDYREQQALPDLLRQRLDQLALRFAHYHSLRDGGSSVEDAS